MNVAQLDLIKTLLPAIWKVTFLVSAIMVMLLVFIYEIGKIIDNTRIYVWAHDELMQLIVSFAVVGITLSLLGMATNINYPINSLNNPYSISVSGHTLYDGALLYLFNAANMAHNVMRNARYYVAEIYLDQSLSHWKCPVWCFMSQGGTGSAVMPYAGKSYFLSVFILFFQTALMESMMSLVHVQFLTSIYTGLLLFLLPLSIILRSTPGLRPVGGVMLSLIVSLYLVYPFIFIMCAYVFNIPHYTALDDKDLAVGAGLSSWLSGTISVPTVGFSDLTSILNELGNCTFYVLFLENAALLAMVGASVYLSRLFGTQVNFSGLLQVI